MTLSQYHTITVHPTSCNCVLCYVSTCSLWMNALPLSSRFTGAPRAVPREATVCHGVAVAVSPDLALLFLLLCYSCSFATVGKNEDCIFWQPGS